MKTPRSKFRFLVLLIVAAFIGFTLMGSIGFARMMMFSRFNNQSQMGWQQAQPYQPEMPNPRSNYGSVNLEGMNVWLVDDNGDGIPDRGVLGAQSAPQPSFGQGYRNDRPRGQQGYNAQPSYGQNYAPQPNFGQGYYAPQYSQGYAPQPNFGQGGYNNSQPNFGYQMSGHQQGESFNPRNMGRGQMRGGGGLFGGLFFLVFSVIKLAVLVAILGFGFTFLRGFWKGFRSAHR